MLEAADVTLSSGLWRDGRCERAVRFAALDAAAERALVDALAAAVPARRVTELLAATVAAIGDVRPVGLDEARALTIGDRDRIVLALRGELVGDDMECVCDCACGETLELTVSVSGLLADPPDEPAPLEGAADGVRVRAASGADHERAALRALDDPDAAMRELVSACVLDADAFDGDALESAARMLEQLDPGAEILLRGTCPACGAAVVAALDPGAYLWTELERRSERLELDVHALASRYHWSEAEIVALDPARRARYIALIDAEAGA
jgi:hypothetical protein